MEIDTLPEKIADRVVAGKGRFKATSAALRAKDCHGGIMDTKVGTTHAEIMMRFTGGRWPGTKVVQLYRPVGVMVSHITGLLSQFRYDMEAMEGQQDGVYEVVVGVCKTNSYLFGVFC